MTIYPNEKAMEESLAARTKFFEEHEHLINMDQSFFMKVL